MEIKELKYEETPFLKKEQNNKMKIFVTGIKYIIDNKIKYCELLDMPFAASTSNADLVSRARRVTEHELRKITGHRQEIVNFFTFSKCNVNGDWHWYAKFDVEAWEEAVQKGQATENGKEET